MEMSKLVIGLHPFDVLPGACATALKCMESIDQVVAGKETSVPVFFSAKER